MIETPSGWEHTTIGEVVALQRGFDITKKEQHDGSVPVVSSGGISSWHNRAMAKGPGVILGRKGTLGRAYYVAGDYWPHDTTLWVRDFKGNDPRFVYYFFRGLDFRYLDVGSANPTLNRNHVHPLPTVWPPVEEQQAIAEVLGAFDDKIEANARLVPLLRDLAKSLLQRAVDPSSSYVVGDVADVRKGLSYTGAGLADAGVPMVNLANAENFGWLKRSGLKHYTGAYKPRHVADPGALLISGVEQTWRYEIIGWPMLLPEDVGPALFSQDVFVVDFRPETAWLRLPLWAHLYTPEARARLEGMVYGTTVARFPSEALDGLVFRAPAQDDAVLATAADLLRRAWTAERESEALAALRDALLPPLLSGVLRVRDADARVTDVV